MNNNSELIIGKDANNMMKFYQEIFDAEEIKTLFSDKHEEVMSNGIENKETWLKDGVIYVVTKIGEYENSAPTHSRIVAMHNDYVVKIIFNIFREEFKNDLKNYEKEYISEVSHYTNVGKLQIIVWDNEWFGGAKGYYTGAECFDEEIRQFVNYIHDSYGQIEE